MDEIEKKVETETKPSAVPSGMTEERVTKRVIRRRAAAPTPPTEPKTETPEEHLEVSPPPFLPKEGIVSEENLAPLVETSSLASPSVTSLEEPPFVPADESVEETKTLVTDENMSPPMVSEPGPSEEAGNPLQDQGYVAKYKRIKVVAVPPPEPLPPFKRSPKKIETSGSKSGSPSFHSAHLSSPGSMGLGHKEIIEIRDYKKLKGSKKKRLIPGRKGKKTEITVPKAAKRLIRISDTITVSELAKRMSVKAGDVISKLMGLGMVVTINQNIDVDTASVVASEFNYEIENVALTPQDLILAQEKEQETSQPEDLKPRPPVVTVMGHVDHGKTSLLDRIRKSDVVSGEAGGITQHIGAYSVKLENGRSITFIDTPGHEAFTTMRARGAQVTDLVILVVAGDDGVMPQTKEAINHAQAAKVPILVAINKMDKPGVDVERIKKALTEFNMVPEEWGGDTLYVPVSAKTGDGVSQLLEMLLLRADMLELKSDPKRLAKGVVLESSLDKRRGVVTTVLVQEGTLHEGDLLVAGTQFGKVRAMRDERTPRLREAGPSKAAEVMGLTTVGTAGDSFSVISDERKAKQIAELRQNISRQQEMGKNTKVSLDDLYQKIEKGEMKELRLVLKADTAGSVEVLVEALQRLSTPKVNVRVIHSAVGGVSENDVMLARASSALIVAFHLRPDASVTSLAEQQKVEIRSYDIIYELTDDITKSMTGLLAPKKVEKVLGHAEVTQVFNIPKVGVVAGCIVKDGKIQRSNSVRLLRDSVPVYSGALKSLKRFKDDAKEVGQGLECGLSIENFNDIKVGDVLESFEVQEVAAELN